MSNFSLTPTETAAAVDVLVQQSHGLASACGWWKDPKTGEQKERNDGELLALIHSEISEALEGVRKNKDDEHLPQFKSVEVELGDAVIRICDMAGARGYRLGAAIAAKLAYNAERADHKPENRAKEDGKKF